MAKSGSKVKIRDFDGFTSFKSYLFNDNLYLLLLIKIIEVFQKIQSQCIRM